MFIKVVSAIKGSVLNSYLAALFCVLVCAVPPMASAQLQNCGGTCNIGDPRCEGSVNGYFVDAVPSGQQCEFKGTIVNTSNVNVSNALLSLAYGNNCVGNLPVHFPGCQVVSFTEQCDAGAVAFQTDDSARITITSKTCWTPRSISGQVLYQATPGGSTSPISNVSVTRSGGSGATVKTNSSGNYSFSTLKPGNYNLSVQDLSARNFVPQSPATNFSNPVVVSGSANITNKNFYFKCKDGYAFQNGECLPTYGTRGYVLYEADDGTTTGIVNAKVTVSGNGVTPQTFVTSPSDPNIGQFRFFGLFAGTYNLDVDKSGLATRNFVFKRGYDGYPNVTITNADVPGRHFYFGCKSGYIFKDGSCVLPPPPPIKLTASDGTFADYVLVEWEAASCGGTYTLYRSDFSDGSQAIIVNQGLTAVTYQDTTAVPGANYYYFVQAACTSSNIDLGYRQGVLDCNRNGVPDETEIAEGKDPCGDIASPAFAKWNTFLSQQNFLELIASGTARVEAKVTAYSISGKVLGVQNVGLDPGQEFDVNVNELVNVKDTYGLVRIEWNYQTTGARILGRLANYRPDPGKNTYSFAFAKELFNPRKGRTFATGNSYDPQGQGYTVPNWMELQNVDTKAQTFTYNLYNQGGDLIQQKVFTVPALGEWDIQAGHENGQGVYLAEVIPQDGAAMYLMTVSRYSSNSFGGNEAETYNFAFALQGRTATSMPQYMIASNRTDGCFAETNWIEVTNVRTKSVNARVVFKRQDGSVIGETTETLAGHSQFHFNASAMIDKDQIGIAEVSGDIQNSLIVQGLTYCHDNSGNKVLTAYASPAQSMSRPTLKGTYNSNLGMENQLRVISITGDTVDVTISGKTFTGSLPTVNATLGAESALDYNFESAFGTEANTYGTIEVDTPDQNQAIGEVIRVRRIPGSQLLDYVMYTPLN